VRSPNYTGGEIRKVLSGLCFKFVKLAGFGWNVFELLKYFRLAIFLSGKPFDFVFDFAEASFAG
jgi:hypothetical protein